MTSRLLKVRVRRRYHLSKQQVGNLSEQTGRKIDRHIISRIERLLHIWRFLIVWFLLFGLLTGCVIIQSDALSNYYQTIQGVLGGIYTEGLLGDFTTANPLYAANPVDNTLSKLVFGSLLTYNAQNQLVGDLAAGWSVDATGKVYTVRLKPNLTWQDGRPLTAADVVFTYQTIQNPDAQSDLNASWQNVTVAAPSPLTVTFTLANPLSSFPYSLTNGIVPEHLLSNIPVTELRSASFNTAPIGSGPFEWKALEVAGDTPTTRQEQIILTPFAGYNGGQPKLAQFIVRAFHDQTALMNSFTNGSLTAVAGLDSLPKNFSNNKNLHIYSQPLTAANMVFFKTSSGVLADASVRQALIQAANVNQIISGLGYPVIPVREPLLIGQLGFNAAYEQVSGNPSAAAATLQQDGWVVGKDNVRYKNGQPLQFSLYASNDPDSRYVTLALQKEWAAVGVNVEVITQSSADLQDTVSLHNYDALLYGISLGVDPDVFVYWDSSQANPLSPDRLNFSEYKSDIVDQSLEAGRTRSDPGLRVVKYVPFLQAWQQDAPALGLYQPRYLYVTHTNVYGLSDTKLNTSTDLLNNVQNWEIRTGKVTD